jgi:arsenite methyltransferase
MWCATLFFFLINMSITLVQIPIQLIIKGNPTAIASLKEAETVIDLGSGGGFDCFLASKKVGPNGKVIGIDMTQDMIDLATMNAANKGYTNVEFRLGEIESLPVASGIADVIISNCVVNLSPEKEKVFREASRVLKPGGRIAISDVVALGTMPDSLKNNPDLYTGCMSGAMEIEKLKSIIENSGFGEVEIRIKPESREYIANWAPGTSVEDYVIAADIHAIKI